MPLGRVLSHSTKSFPSGSIVIHLYGDVDTPADERVFLISRPGRSFTAEHLCMLVGHKLSIGTLALHLFSLATPDHKLWLPPNHEVVCPTEYYIEYIFRVRFIPHWEHIERRTFGLDAFGYFFLQVRDDFVKDRLKDALAEVERERILGLGVTDNHRYGRDHNLDLNETQKRGPKKFLPESVIATFTKPGLLLLKNSFRTELKKAYADGSGSNVQKIKLQYLKGIWMYVPSYGIETFVLDSEIMESLRVDPYYSEFSGIIRLTQNKKEPVCSIDDVLNLRLFESENRVQVDRSQGIPYVFTFPSTALAKSFISLVDGYHRLSKNFLFHVCSAISSPTLEMLKELRFHGPVSKDWAKLYLQDHHKQRPKYNYLVKQRGRDSGSYLLLFISPRDSSKRVITLSINQLPNGLFQIALQHEPIFDTLQQLLQHYEQGSHPTIHLINRLGPPTQHPVPEDAGLYLCKPLPKILDEDEEEELSAPPHHKKAAVSLVSGVNILPDKLGAGQFTVVYKGFLEKEDGLQVVGVAVKQLVPNATIPGAYEAFLESCHKLAFWCHPTIVSVAAICLSPRLQVLQELAELGCLEEYLHNPKEKLLINHLLIAAEQISQAVLYLQQECSRVSSFVHGNIRCRSILVFSHTKDNLVIKLGDPGMVSHYNNLPLSNDVNLDRLPWIAPELHKDLTAMTIHSDRFSLGITFWEMFSLGDRPFLHSSAQQVKLLTSQGTHLDQPVNCPEEMYLMMKKCWKVEAELRPTAQEIVRDVRNISQMMDTGHEYSEASSHYNLENLGELPFTARAAIDAAARENTMTAYGEDDDLLFSEADGKDLDSKDLESPLVNPSSPVSPPLSGGSISTVGSTVPLLGPDWSGALNTLPMITGLPAPSLSNDHVTALALPPESSLKGQFQRPLPEIPGLKYILKREHILMDPSMKPLGMGYYGTVHEADYLEDGKKPSRKVAIKSLKANMYNQHAVEFENEFNTMVKLKHRNIVSIIGQCPQRDSENPMLLVMEYIENGCLLHYLTERKNKIPKKRLLDFAEEVAEGMVYLSDQRIVHRDLAARNVLVTTDITMKISDFGLARCLDPHRNYYKSKPSCEMPYRWCAPESLIYQKFSTQSDVWSYGITLWEIFSFGRPPVLCEDRSLHNALLRGRRLGCPEGCPKDIHNLMMSCWEYYALNRKSFKDILLVLKKFQESGICGTADNASFVDSGPSLKDMHF